jgi:alpha-beta hydrolase superfamily lysophospholipase
MILPEPKREFMKHWTGRRMIIMILLAIGLCLLIRGPSVMRYVEAGFLLADIVAGDSCSVARHMRSRVDKRTVSYRWEGRARSADLYRPAGTARAGLVLLPGVAELGGDDPRLVAFARALARAGFVVLVPELAGLRQLRVSFSDVQEVTDAFAWLVRQQELVPAGKAGLAAFSYASGPALLAAMDDAIRDQVAFVFAVGGYHDLRRVLTYFTTGYYVHNGREKYLSPDDYGKWAFVAGNLDRIEDETDRKLLTTLARRLWRDPAAVTDDLVPSLGREGRSLWAFVNNRDPRLVPSLLAALPEAIRQEISSLNLAAHDLSRLRAPLILVHGYEDPMIPFTESISLARGVSNGRARLYLVHGLVHVDVAPALPDRWRLWLAMHDLLAARDGALGF